MNDHSIDSMVMITGDEYERLRADNKVLRAVNDALSEQMMTMINNASTVAALKDENERLKDENKKLRGAIETTAVLVERIHGNARLADMIRASATQQQEEKRDE